ncbi:NAD(P)/FAD-dependent oxidoreductase [Halostreptopolyspora alba]|uniref:FAD-binding oxidoreductase n=1 Tax=Halostreptopolyspora alba TaxID=2487137 RepID=A0A3N0EI60_9ACTN|nr:FAD-binding oxidoreductase [Nocardiopsaceae bacterium YIM 96095]
MPKTVVDIAVVGAGIVGSLVATEVLRRRPHATVAILDRGFAGDGASRRSAGLHIPRGLTPTVRSWTRLSENYYRELVTERPDLGIRSLTMNVLTRSTHPERLSEIYLGRPVPAREGAPEPLDRLPSDATAWSVAGAQHADVQSVTAALTARLRHSAAVHEGVEVSGLTEADDHVALTTATGRTVHAREVVLAPGPWLSHRAWRPLVAELPVRVKKVVALHVDAVPPSRSPTVVFHDEDAFLLPLPDRGHWLFSYTSHDWDVRPETLPSALTSADLDEGRDVLRSWAPHLADRVHSGRVFCDAYAASGEPDVRALTPRIVFAGAANGSGYRLGPAIATRTADLLARSADREGLTQ